MAKRNLRRGSKSQAVREYLAQHPQASAGEVVSALTEQGITVSRAIVYYLRSVEKKAGKGRGRRSTTVRSANGIARRVGRPRAATSAAISADQLLATKELADRLGGMEALCRTLDLLEQLR